MVALGASAHSLFRHPHPLQRTSLRPRRSKRAGGTASHLAMAFSRTGRRGQTYRLGCMSQQPLLVAYSRQDLDNPPCGFGATPTAALTHSLGPKPACLLAAAAERRSPEKKTALNKSLPSGYPVYIAGNREQRRHTKHVCAPVCLLLARWNARLLYSETSLRCRHR